VLKEQFPGKVDCLLNALRYGMFTTCAKIIYITRGSLSSAFHHDVSTLMIGFSCCCSLGLGYDYYAPPIGKGAISPSICLSVRLLHTERIIQEPKGLACPNLEGRFPTFDVTRIPVLRSKGQSSRSPGPLMLTHIVCHIFRMARPTNFKLGVWMEDDDPLQPLVQ